MKQASISWPLGMGLFSVIWQILSYYLRFGEFNPYSSWMDYVGFFIAGILGGFLLVLFLNRQAASKGRLWVIIAFMLATPIAMIFMLGGGLLGLVGVIVFPQIPWGIAMWLGSVVGRFVSK